MMRVLNGLGNSNILGVIVGEKLKFSEHVMFVRCLKNQYYPQAYACFIQKDEKITF